MRFVLARWEEGFRIGSP